MSRNIPEVLAPAGSPEALVAAVRCGAAAVYLGAGAFNARRFARNFSPQELREAVAYCHARGVAVHLTLNTLLRQDELPAAVDTAILACECGVDALIVQDTGLARQLRAVMPAMPLHASTQLSCHSPAGVQLLREAGFSRVVLSREMSREEIAACAGLGVELEVFVHGALCMCVSGQCYFSAMLGGRSGNRGQCAQTCRLPFAPTGDRPRPCPPEQAALSLKDLCLAEYVQELAQLGVASLKIEGRMKRPEYVAAATAVYAAAARRESVSPAQLEELRQIFSRSGFTDGYYTARRGGAMFGVRRKEDVTAAAGVLNRLQHTFDRENPLIGIELDFLADATATSLTARDADGHAVTVTGPGGEPAVRRPLDADRAAAQLKKTGGTPFSIQACRITLDDGLTVPAAQLNALRREALEQLLAERSRIRPIPYERRALPPQPAAAPRAATARQYIRLADAAQWSPALTAERLFVPLSTPPEQLRQLREAVGGALGVEIPRGLFGTEEAVRTALRQAAGCGATAALCGNIGALPLARAAGLTAVGGFGLNIFNRDAAEFYRTAGLAEATLSMELTFAQLSALLPVSLPAGLLIYGRQPLMLTRNCPRRAALGGCAGCHGQGITDRTGTAFPVMCSGGCSEVLNSVPLYWGDHPADIPPVDFHLFHFTTETAAEAAAVLEAYHRGAPPSTAITRGLYRRGVQ